MISEEYKANVYAINSNDSARFLLGESGKNPLFIFGVNPSTATNISPDRTIKKVKTFARNMNIFDGWIMMNLYPQRSTNPQNLHITCNSILHNENKKKIFDIVSKTSNPQIWAAWGNPVGNRDYLLDCLKDINETLKPLMPKWFHLGEFTKPKNPRHPSRLPYQSDRFSFDVENYIEK